MCCYENILGFLELVFFLSTSLFGLIDNFVLWKLSQLFVG